MPRPHDIADLRARLASGTGPEVWRSLEAVAETPAFRDFLTKEFPSASRLADGPDRRQFFRLMAASFALAGLSACSADPSNPRNHEIPYVRNPERVEPSAPLVYASATLLDGVANGAAVTTFDGRPIKVEGNDRHPWSRGGTDVFLQASILDLYDPLRAQTVLYLNRISSWEAFRGATLGRFAAIRADGGEGLRLLTGPVTSPTLLASIDAMRAAYPKMRWHVHAPAAGEALAGAAAAFGRPLQARYDFGRARVVVAIDGDFLDAGPAQIGQARGWVEARRASAAAGSLLVLHSAAPTPSLTSAKADYHVAVDASDMEGLVARLAAEVDAPTDPAAGDLVGQWVKRAGAALAADRGRGIVAAGAHQPAAVHEAVHRLNAALGNHGTEGAGAGGAPVFFTAPVAAAAEPFADLVRDMASGSVKSLVMLDTNPAYTAPGDLDFAQAIQKVPLRIQCGNTVDETSAYVDWHLPRVHPLESWGDARAWDGTVSLYQPTVYPLFDGRSDLEVLSILTDPQPRDGMAILRDFHAAEHAKGREPGVFEAFWRKTLLDGFVEGSAFAPEAVTLTAARPAAAQPSGQPARDPKLLDVVFRPDPTVWTGATANNGWLQELPKPLTKVVWSNYVAVSPSLAERESIATGDMVRVAVGDAGVEGPAWVMPGQAPDTVTLFLGYGRAVRDMLFSGLGYSAFPLRAESDPSLRTGAALTKLGKQIRLATTQDHSTMEGHDIVKVHRVGGPKTESFPYDAPSFYDFTAKKGEDDGRAWGMVIDQDSCIGCNACVVSCQAENNIPVVGAHEVSIGREMHWLRIDRYYSGLKTGAGLDDPDTHFQPVLCMHCEEAPCEVGCPVEATIHDHEGLNLMVYNRCVGTRACSGYCPYKVRHFNYLDYTGGMPPVTQLQRNPEVTVRARGVMEKCTYCVQRIASARIESDKSNAPIADGAVKTACQAACPTRAITFGDLMDKNSAVLKARQDPRNYALLGELNVKPRTTYLAELAPAVSDPQGSSHAGDPQPARKG